jgi:hypothetical protein
MNPYSPSAMINQQRAKAKVFYFAITSFLTYANVVVYNLGGPSRAFTQYSESPIGFVVEACLILVASGSAGLIGAHWLGTEISENAVTLSRAIGGIAFTASFVTSQPFFLLPFFAGLLTPLERTPFNAIARFYATMFTQPYIMITTIIVSGIFAWCVERLWRSHISKSNWDELGIAPKLR